MPKEISRERFPELLSKAISVTVVKRGDDAKVKLRTKKTLYTLKVKSGDADQLLKDVKIPVEEL